MQCNDEIISSLAYTTQSKWYSSKKQKKKKIQKLLLTINLSEQFEN